MVSKDDDAGRQCSDWRAESQPPSTLTICTQDDVFRAQIIGMRRAANIAAGWKTGAQAALDIRREALRLESLADAKGLNPSANY